MLFHITQAHTPEACPKDVGGSKTLYDPNVEGVKLRAIYGAFSQHVIYYIVEADSLKAVNKFLDPGWTRCTVTGTPVSEEPIER
ncbi:MAG: hypothetical protein ACE5IW_01140 [bacterium]